MPVLNSTVFATQAPLYPGTYTVNGLRFIVAREDSVMPAFEEVILDPRDGADVTEQALIYVDNRSGGVLSDRSDNSNLRVVYEGFTFCAEELQYYTNKLSKALAIRFLSNLGKTPANGTKAKCTLRFTLQNSLGNSFAVPAGFTVAATNELRFLTDTVLTIPAGQTEGTVTATAEFVGSAYQLAASTVNMPQLSLVGLQAVTNIDNCTGGSDAETEAQAFARIAVELRSFALADTSEDIGLRIAKDDKTYYSLITKEEYENFVEKILGPNSFARAVSNVAGDRVSYLPATVHVFTLDANGNTPNQASLSDVRAKVTDRTFMGATSYISSFDKYPVSMIVSASVAGTNLALAAADIKSAFQLYVKNWSNQFLFDKFATLYTNEVEHAVRALPFVRKINNIGLTTVPNNAVIATADKITATNYYTLLDAADSNITVVSPTGTLYSSSDKLTNVPSFTQQDFVNSLIFCFEGENGKDLSNPLAPTIGYPSGVPSNFDFCFATNGVANVQQVVAAYTPVRLAASVYNQLTNATALPTIPRKTAPGTRVQVTRGAVYYYSISQGKWIFITLQPLSGAAYAEDFSYLEPSQEVTGADYRADGDELYSMRSGIGNAAGSAIGQAGGRVANQRLSNRGDQVGYNFHGFGTRQPLVWTDVKAIYAAQGARLIKNDPTDTITDDVYLLNLGFDAWPDLQAGGFNFGFNGGRYVKVTRNWQLITCYAGPPPADGFVGVGVPPVPVF